ncbi:MAG: tRNA (adenosine(37)-N6)-threonylcarbamoyltransferase complex ATPase subunit type 1 TsaE [Firmicutes bacterium]|mgnify:CR=1 FL=1|nr:tRNA (adenosine(37)-N6)-threonylcarbamoyltransferase complex ATPase subunit type 1 TsaE [Bacillota bacterium]
MNKKVIVTTCNENETRRVGEILGQMIQVPLVVVLDGKLGTGKTVMVKGAARGLGVTEVVRSPTFTIMMVYRGRLPLFHFDFYRLDDRMELDALDLEEYLEGQGVAFIEWGTRFAECLPPERMDIRLAYSEGDMSSTERVITFYPHGRAATALLDRMSEKLEYNFEGEIR